VLARRESAWLRQIRARSDDKFWLDGVFAQSRTKVSFLHLRNDHVQFEAFADVAAKGVATTVVPIDRDDLGELSAHVRLAADLEPVPGHKLFGTLDTTFDRGVFSATGRLAYASEKIRGVMKVKRQFGAAGHWTFQTPLGSVAHYDRASLDKLLDLLVVAATVLERHELLRPSQLTFHRWLSVKGETRAPEPDTHVAVNGSAEISKRARSVLDALDTQRQFRQVGRVQITGSGTALDASGQAHVMDDLVWLYGYELDGYVIEVATQRDVWMAYSFTGEPQPELARHNAPRLERALRDVESALGLPCDRDGDRTRFAVSKCYAMVNHLYDEETEPIPVESPDFYLEPG
jgi:hypothetical protein